MNVYAAQAQQRTINDAENRGEAWTQFEVDALLEFTDVETDEEIARMIGRTLYAVVAKQHELRNGRVATGTRRRTRERVELAYDRGFTTLEAYFAGD